MVRFKSFSPPTLLLVPAFVLLLLTVISTPITRFVSLGSANGTKFGVFGYCYTNDTCSGIQVGYNPDDVLDDVSTSSFSRRSLPQVFAHLAKRQNSPPGGGGGVGNDSPFNLPSNARNNLTYILIVHVVAAGLTLLLLIMSIFGHFQGPSNSTAYMMTTIILSIPVVVLTLLAFLADILIFVPNLDWGTWITLVATVLNTLASILICTARRRVKTRSAMKARIAENDLMNGENYHNSQHLQRDDPPPLVVRQELETDKATLPRFAQFDLDRPEPDAERIPLNTMDPDGHSMRSDTPSRSSPPRYPPTDNQGYAVAPYDSQEPHLNSSPYGENDYSRARIPYGNPPRQQPARNDGRGRGPRSLRREESDRSIAPPLAHLDSSDSLADNNYGDDRQQYAQQWPIADSQQRGPGDMTDPDDPSPQDAWNRSRGAQQRQKRQRVVSGPRPMPQQQPVRSPSGNYYEDAPPQFDQPVAQFPEDEYMQHRMRTNGSRRHTPQGSASFDRPAYPQQPRSPDTLSNSSHFTSVSQRGINPAWHENGPLQQQQQHGGPGMPHSQSQQSFTRGPRGGRPHQQQQQQQQPNILADNPDFVLPGVTAGRSRLPASRRPGAIPGLSSSNLGMGASPYAIAKQT